MKKLLKLTLVILFTITFFSCKDKITDTYLVNEPIYMSYTDLRKSFEVQPAEEIIQPGKIYFKDDFIFVNEYQKGIHIINNADPANPDVVKFLEIPGNVDISIKGNILYADSYIDLLSIDISDINNIIEVDRDTNVLPYIIPDIEDGIITPIDQNLGVITGYQVSEITEEVEENQISYGRFLRWEDVAFSTNEIGAKQYVPSGSDAGTGGSMARFTIYENYLYVVDNHYLKLFNLDNEKNPVFEKDFYAGRDIETIFPYENKLFIGSMIGMYVYNIEDPSNPVFISEFNHGKACDPVVVDGNYAYVTLRGGNACGAVTSELNVIDISNINEPKLIKSYPMEDPYGLGIDNNVLFVCDGDAGLKIYNASDKMNIDSNMLASYPEMDAFDVIPLGNVLIMISVEGLFQYDYSSLDSIKQLSFIPIYSKSN